MTLRATVLTAALLALAGCDFGRHAVLRPGENQVIRVESGDRLFFDLEEDRQAGCRWECACDDADVEVQIAHADGPSGKAKVTIRIHRGYDGPSALRFRRTGGSAASPSPDFTITLFRRTGDSAFWK